MFEKINKNPDKIQKTAKSARKEMRALANLYKIFLTQEPPAPLSKFNNCKDLFHLQNFDQLRQSIYTYTRKENDDVKSGLKINLKYIIINAAEIYKATGYLQSNEEEASLFEKFLRCIAD